MDESRADDEEFEALSEPLPDRPFLRPLRYWVSERAVSGFLAQVLGFVWILLICLSRPSRPESVTLWIALVVTIGAFAAAGPIARRWRAQACRRSPHEPWRHDRAWSERGETRSWFARMAGASIAGGGYTRFAMVVLTMLGFALTTGRLAWAATAPFGAVATLLCIAAWRIHGVGDSRLSYSKFPFHPGERATLYFGMSEGGAQFRRVEFSLFHVREFRGATLALQHGVRPTLFMIDRRPPGPPPGPEFDVELTFDVPHDAPGTRITEEPPEYWVLEIRGVTSAGPYFERFLIPIYARPEPADGIVDGSGSVSPARAPGGST